jgi:hypothetical protein
MTGASVTGRQVAGCRLSIVNTAKPSIPAIKGLYGQKPEILGCPDGLNGQLHSFLLQVHSLEEWKISDLEHLQHVDSIKA